MYSLLYEVYGDCGTEQFATSGVGGRSSIWCCEQNKRLYGQMTDILKIPENMGAIFTAGDGKECSVWTGDWVVLVM